MPADPLSGVVPMDDGEHRAQLFALYHQIFGATKAERLRERFDWQYRQSPARRPGQAASWVLVRAGRVVGHLSVIHVEMQAGDARWQGCWGCDLLVHPEHRRGKGLRALLAALDGAADLPMGYGMGDVVGRTYQRLGYRRLAIGSHLIRFRSARGALKLRAANDARGRPARVAVQVRGRIRHLLHYLSRRRATPDLGGWEAEIADPDGGATAEAEDLWRRIAGGYPLAAVRSRAHLAWRYGWRGAAARFLLLRRQRRLEAIAVLEACRWRGLRVGQISELLVPRSEAPALVPVVAHLVSQALARQRIDALLTEGFPSDLRRAFTASGFHACVEGRRETAVILDRDRLPAELASDPDNWLLTAGDSDRSTSYPRLRWAI